MEKKYLGIVCVVLMALSIVIYTLQGNYQKKQMKEQAEQAEQARLDSLAVLEAYKPLSLSLETEMKNFISSIVKEKGVEDMAKRLYFITINKDADGEYLRMFTGYGFNKDDVKGFTYLNDEVIIYYGNKVGTAQSVIDESQLYTDMNQIEYYKEQKSDKNEQISSRKYKIVNGNELELSEKDKK